MSFLWDALGIPSTRVPLNLMTLVSYVLPPMVGGAIIGLLAIDGELYQRRAVRLTLWPVVAFLALRAAIGVDMSLGKPGFKIGNAYFCICMFCIPVRALDFACAKKPLVRHLRPANSTPSIFLDAIDLAVNHRGIGWNWSNGLHILPETRPTNRIPFALWTFLFAVRYIIEFGVFHRAVLSFPGIASAEVPTIFDDSLPFALRYLRAALISTLSAFTIYAFLQMGYGLAATFAVLILRQDPAQWPPLLKTPWVATSLIELWGRRWHQYCRHVLIILAFPFTRLFGRTGTVLGVFLASGVMHDLFLFSMNPCAEHWRMLVGFGMMGPAVLAERTFYEVTGRKVGGFAGWVWVYAWTSVLGIGIIEGIAQAGGLGNTSIVDGVWVVRVVIEQLVARFDGWLHAI